MSINVPSCLLKHAKQLAIELEVSTFSDRQLKNIARQVTSGSISDGLSATSRVARMIANKHGSPFISYGNWRVQFKDIASDHPIHEAMVQACSLTKIAEHESNSWFMRNIDESIKEAEQRKATGGYGVYWLSDEAKRIMRQASKLTVPADHKVHAYIKQLLNREIETVVIELQ